MIRRGFTRKLLVIATLLSFALSRGYLNHLALVMGTGVLVLGVVLHLWTKGCLIRNDEVTTWGPYRFVRHPFYLANALVDLGICIIANTWLIYAAYPVLFVIAYSYTIGYEEKRMADRHGEVWQRYRERVPVILPCRWPAPRVPGRGFRWINLMREGELSRALRLLAYPLLFHLWGDMIQQGTHFFRVPQLEPMLQFILMLVLYGSSFIVHRVFERPIREKFQAEEKKKEASQG